MCEHIFGEQREEELLGVTARRRGEQRATQLWGRRLQQLLPEQR